MHGSNALIALLLCSMSLGISSPCMAQKSKALIAVASNFSQPAQALAREFSAESDATVEFSFSATGKHYIQIINGAPFDAFLSADAQRTKLLEEEGKTITDTRFVYALGRLALWSLKPDVVDANGRILHMGSYRHLAIAKPEIAPYGLAARQVLEREKLWESVQPHLVFGENITQTFQFVHSGNAQIGFVAWPQVKSLPADTQGSFWKVPASHHAPILQEAVLLKNNPTARQFLLFLQTPKARSIIADFGYDLPEKSEAGEVPTPTASLDKP